MLKDSPEKQAVIMSMIDEADQKEGPKPSATKGSGNGAAGLSFLKWMLIALYIMPFIHSPLYDNRWTYWLLMTAGLVVLFFGGIWIISRKNQKK